MAAADSHTQETRNMLLNIGPSHPAMHGVIRLITELDGEKVVKVEAEIGYLHRAFEKSCENSSWTQAIPYTDRLNYVSPLINNFGYCAAVEKLLGIEITERCKYIRVVMSEISRITDHLTCIAASAMETGGDDRLPLLHEGPRISVRNRRGGHRRAPDDLLRPDRRGEGGSPGRIWARSSKPRSRRSRRRCTRSTSCSPATGSSSTGRGMSAS